MSSSEIGDVGRSEKINALADVAKFNPKFTALIVLLGLVAAFLEGVGLSFILPIIEIVQADDPVAEADGLMEIFVTLYQTLGIPFSLSYVIVGVALVMTVRYTTSFVAAWFREALRTYYVRDLQVRAFENALNARVEYFDKEGNDDMLNAIVTQTYYAGRVIQRIAKSLEFLFLSLMYMIVGFIISPVLTVLAVTILGGLTYLLRSTVDPGYQVGDTVADANERRQEAAQAGTQGIRDVRIFGLVNELHNDFIRAVNQYTDAQIRLRRNEAGINNFYNLGVALSVFALIYVALMFANLSVGELAVFLFAMVQIGPKVSKLNKYYYKVENDLPHLVRTQQFIQELERHEETNEPVQNVPDEVTIVAFDDVWFSYDSEEQVLKGVDFEVEKGEFVAFVGQSGAGKSTIVSLLARLYEIERGRITANRIPIDKMEINEWREKIAVVRQKPFIFNDTLRYNLTIGNRQVSESELRRVCEIAQIDEFLDELPKGFDTVLGDDGVRLSGGQKQRIALARALVEDADVLVLDEATSDLDSNLEQKVQRAIESMDRELAIIAIAHRLSTVENADRIFTMEDGRITESGTHNELLGSDGTYAELYEIQSG